MLIVSEKAQRVGARLLTPSFSNESTALPAVLVTVENRASAPVPFSTGNVTVFSGTNPVRIYTPAQLAEKIEKESEIDADRAVARDTAQLQSATAARMDASATPMMVQRTQAINQGTAARSAASKQVAVLANLLYPVTIASGATAGGVIKLRAEDIASGQPLRIVVTLGSDVHEFIFDVKS